MSIEVLSPTRVDLAGGTLDCWPLYLFLNNPVTINIGVSIFTRARIEVLPTPELHLISKDQSAEWTFKDLSELSSSTDQRLRLVQEICRYWEALGYREKIRGLRITTDSESPIGGGLGGSSSLTISTLKAFGRFLNHSFGTDADLVRLASHIEARILEKPTGTQDYFPALEGGLCRIHYEADGPRLERSPIPIELFRSRFLLVYTGRAHHSGLNNWHVIRGYLDGDTGIRTQMQRLAQISNRISVAVQNNDSDALSSLFKEELVARIALSKGFSSPEIEDLNEAVQQLGATVKICGAGGGGSVMIWCPNRNTDAVATKVTAMGFKVLPAEPWMRQG